MADNRFVYHARPKNEEPAAGQQKAAPVTPAPAKKKPAPKPAPPKPPARKPAAARPPRAPKPPRTPKPPRAPKKRRRIKPIVPLILLVLLAILICIVLVIVKRPQGPTGPAVADFGTPAEPWQKNELGYYFNESGDPIPAAVLKGIDVSKYQGEVDWEKAKAAGIDFAILRCGFGGEWDGEQQNWNQDDAQWRRNADECTRLGIPFGVYLYSYATDEEEARSEADHVARLLGLTPAPHEGLESYTDTPYTLSYPLYYDLEDKYITGVFPDEMASITTAFFERMQSYGYAGKQGLYASLNWVRGRFESSAFDPWRENLWIARFADELGYTGTYDMWQSSYTAPGADYGVQSETVDIDFVMRPFAVTGLTAGQGKTIDPSFVNDTRQLELHLDAKDARATLVTNAPPPQPDEEGNVSTDPTVFWTTSDKEVATVDKTGQVLAKNDGSCTVTATLADGTESCSVLVRVGNISVPIFATGRLDGARADDNVSLADVAALKASTADAVLLDAGGSLYGSRTSSLTGGMDMLSTFSAAGYDLQAFGTGDLAFGIARLRENANVASGPSLAANLRDAEGAAIFYRSTSWNRNRITNGMNYTINRAGYTIGFFALADANAAGNIISLLNEETPIANDPAQTATEQVAALRAQGVDAIICIATPGVDVAGLQSTLQSLGVTAVIDGGSREGTAANVLPAGTGLGGIGCLTLTFTPDGRVSTAVSNVAPATLQAGRTTWDALNTAPAEPVTEGENAATAPDADSEAEPVDGEAEKVEETAADSTADATIATEEPVDALQKKGADAYRNTAETIAELDADDESILNTPLFTLAPNTSAQNTIGFANYVAAVYKARAMADLANLSAEDAALELCAVAGGVGELENGDVTRGALMSALPGTARLQLARVSAADAKALVDGGTVTRPYLDSLVEFTPAGENVLLMTDSVTLATLPAGSATLLRDYGDVYWGMRMNINDATNNFANDFVLPEAPVLGVGRGN